MKLVVSDAHEGIKAAVGKIFTATWQRCRVHFIRNALAHAGRSGRRVVSAKARPDAEPDVLAYMSFPTQRRLNLHSTNPLERLNGEIKRRTDVVGIFPNEAAITQLVGAILRERNDESLSDSDEWAVQRARYITLESIAPVGDDPIVGLPAMATWSIRPGPRSS